MITPPLMEEKLSKTAKSPFYMPIIFLMNQKSFHSASPVMKNLYRSNPLKAFILFQFLYKKLGNSYWLKYQNTSWVDFNKKKKKLYIFSFELVFNEQYFRSIFLNKNFVVKGFAQHIPCHFTLKNLIIWMDSNRNICSAFWSDKKITFSYVQAFSIWCHQRVNCFSVKCKNIKIKSHKI